MANLVDNAVKYTPEGGSIALDGRADGDGVVIEVRDTGTGIAPADLPRVWERLYRGDASRSERGLGLGLSLVRAIVQAHGGTVSLASRVGEGTRVTVGLPVEPPPALGVSRRPAQQARQGWQVLSSATGQLG
jgi:signal transduction histidine kinase